MKRALVGIAVCAFIGGLVRFGEAAMPGAANAQLRTAGRSPSNVAARAIVADSVSNTSGTSTQSKYVAAAGTQAAPSFTFSTATSSGIFLKAAANPAIGAGNSTVVDFESNSANFAQRIVMAATKPIFASDGTAALPSYAFGNAQSTGFHAVTTAVIGASASIQFNPAATAQPACVVGLRGVIWYTPGGTGVADEIEICSKQAAGDTYAWRPLDSPIP